MSRSKASCADNNEIMNSEDQRSDCTFVQSYLGPHRPHNSLRQFNGHCKKKTDHHKD